MEGAAQVVEKPVEKPKGNKNNEKEINWDLVDATLAWGATLDMLTHYLCGRGYVLDRTTIERKIRRKFDMTFSEYRDTQMVSIKLKLVQQAINRALNGSDTMLIFCLKNLVGWLDKPQELDTQKSIQNIEDIVKRLNIKGVTNESRTIDVTTDTEENETSSTEN